MRTVTGNFNSRDIRFLHLRCDLEFQKTKVTKKKIEILVKEALVF